MMEERIIIHREFLKAIEERMEKRIKELMAYDLWPNTNTFFLAKLQAQKEEFANYKIDLNFKMSKDLLRKGYRDMLFCLILRKIKFFRNIDNIILVDKLLKLPYKLKPKWWLNMDGHKFLMNEGDASMRAILKDYDIVANRKFIGERLIEQSEKLWEPETTKVVKANVKEGMVCLDIGASVGYFTLLFSRRVGKTGKVFAFEPTTNQIPYIKANVKRNGYEDRAKVFHMGAWDKTEVVEMPVHAPVKYRVECKAVDDVLEAEGISKVDFIKIDVDGVEPRVLKGLIRTIERSPNLKMVVERYPLYIKNAGCDIKDFDDIINQYFNYTVIPDDYSGECENLLCFRK